MRRLLLFLALCLALASCKKEQKLFVPLDSKHTGIEFNNRIIEHDSFNILNTEFIYNGGGAGISDLNGDGLQDVFFTGNQVENKLYLNKGSLRFEDISEQAGIRKNHPQQWSSGINMLDINHDGRQDIYLCNTMHPDPEVRRNQLFVNQGNNAAGFPHFVEMAQAYGIADTTYSSNAQFFDYDNDGDLDLFISTNFMDRRNPNAFVTKITDGTAVNRDRLYRSDWNAQAGHPVFTDITKQAGLIWEGYSHSALVSDFNHDGWLDLYVANDYVTNDLIYINQRDGTFKNQIATIFKHQAASAMGSDVADIDNDGLLDYFTTEMLPYYNKRKKLFLGPNNYAVYINNDNYGYEYQYPRNMLQLNRGINRETGLPVFSDVAFITGTQETEWSWTPLMADFDNDGNRDIFVTNGFPRDVTDHDFGAYRSSYNYLIPPMELQELIPQIKVPKFLFKNQGNLKFEDYSQKWGVAIPAFSNGAAYGDLDNDGDLDLVVNNIDDKAFVFQNTTNDQKEKNNFVRLKIEGPKPNTDAFGATATIYFEGKKQTAQLLSARGYISTSENVVHFGLGKAGKIDSVVVRWNGNVTATLTNVPVNQVVAIKFASHTTPAAAGLPGVVESVDPVAFGLNYLHQDKDFNDFDYQRTLPHKYSEYGPTLTVGDANGDGRDDIYLSGSAYADGMWFVQTTDGKFTPKTVAYKTDPYKREEELGAALFDADGDGDNDLYLVRGSSQHPAGDTLYQDVVCINDGKGNFTIARSALPKEASCGQVVKAADFDGDGDLDLFVGGRVMPRAFPKPDRSFLLRNDTKEKDKPVFTDVTKEICPDIEFAGLVADALWTDFNGDKRPDLLLAGEWMSLTFFQNESGAALKNVTPQSGIADRLGWWSSLAAADFDGDGDTDYMAGSYGQNLYFKGDDREPLRVYAKDFDGNGWYDPFISCYWLDSLGQRREYFYHTRDDMMKQMIALRKKFYSYGAFGEATVQDVFSQKELEGAQIMKTNWMNSSYIENLGNGKFNMTALPWQAQLAPVHGMLPYDIDKDGLIDLLMVGNDYGMELLQGRADAFYGLVLKNLGKNQFKAVELDESHFFVPGDGRALAKVRLAGGQEIIVATQNRGPLKVFMPKGPAGLTHLQK